MPHVLPIAEPAADDRFAIVVSRWNESITSKLLAGALETFTAAGIADDAIHVAWVPGAWELPVVVERLAASGAYQAILPLGAVIRGETTHDRYINHAVSSQLAEIAVRRGVPVLFGLLTCETMEQAIHRAGGNVGNKGAECAEAAIAMVGLLKNLPSHPA
jgi:6,7-dimethyl-8-ribityllumazine synthase